MSEQVVAGETVEIKNLPKEDVQRRMTQLEAAVLTLADSVNKFVNKAPMTAEQKQALDQKADKALKDAARNVDDFRKLKVGDLCHTHDREDQEFNIVKEPCLAVPYHVQNPQGIRLNAVLLTGDLVVPQCTANTLRELDFGAVENEKAIYTNRGRTRYIAEYKG